MTVRRGYGDDLLHGMVRELEPVGEPPDCPQGDSDSERGEEKYDENSGRI